MDYAKYTRRADAALQRYGTQVRVSRAGVSVGAGHGVFASSEGADDTSSSTGLLAQTVVRTRELYLSGLTRAPQVGDVVSADRDQWTVESVDVVRPGTTTLLYILRLK